MALIAVDRDEGYAPCCYLICKVVDGDWDTRDEDGTILVQSDWDWPGLARTFGWDGEDDDIYGASEYLDACVESCKMVESDGYF